MGKGMLVIISGPSGVGKGVICKALFKRDTRLKLSVSATTRAPRPGEAEGVNYFYKTEEEFQRMIQGDEFLEYMHVFGRNYYGTPKAYVREQIQRGYDVVLEIDVRGAMQVMKAWPEAVSIFIAPPSLPELKARLTGRGTETPEAVERRFAESTTELQAIGQYQYVVVNDVLTDAVDAVDAILNAERMRVSRNAELLEHLQKGE